MTKEELIKDRIEIYQEGIKKSELEKDIGSQMYLRGALGELIFLEQKLIDQSQEPKQEERYTHCGGNCKNSTGETSVMCCNYCGLPTEKSWSIGKNIYFNPIEPKQMEVSDAIEFAEWIISNEYEFFDNTSEGNIYISDEKPNKQFTMGELYDLFKSKTK